MAESLYLLCAATSIGCGVLLLRGYRRTGVKLLFWSGLCFAGLAINNILLVLDFMVVPTVDLSLLRRCVALVSMAVLLYGLVWESP